MEGGIKITNQHPMTKLVTICSFWPPFEGFERTSEAFESPFKAFGCTYKALCEYNEKSVENITQVKLWQFLNSCSVSYWIVCSLYVTTSYSLNITIPYSLNITTPCSFNITIPCSLYNVIAFSFSPYICGGARDY